jgi:hypothetical protein
MTICEAVNYLCSDVIPAVKGVTDGVVELRRQGYPTKYYYPATDPHSEVQAGAALLAAIAEAELTPVTKTDVHLTKGRFFIPAGTSFRSIAPTSKDLAIIFQGRSAVCYDDPEDAGKDYMFYRGDRNVINFGAKDIAWYPVLGSDHATVNVKAFQAANNCLPTQYDPEESAGHRGQGYKLTSGRLWRVGRIIVPEGYFVFNKSLFFSPSVVFEGVGWSTILQMNPGNFDADHPGPDPKLEEWFITFERSAVYTAQDAADGLIPPGKGVGDFIVDDNTMFGTQIKNMLITGSGNKRLSGVLFAGQFRQGTRVVNVNIAGFGYRGLVFAGEFIDHAWIANCGRTGVHLWATGGHIGRMSVEHCNPTGEVDLTAAIDPVTGTNFIYPQVQIDGGNWTVGQIQGEMGSGTPLTVVRLNSPQLFKCGLICLGVGNGVNNHTVLRITGDEQTFHGKAIVSVDNVQGLYSGYFAFNPGTLVYDDSASSRTPGTPYIIPGSVLQSPYHQKGPAEPQPTIADATDLPTVIASLNALLATAKTHKLIS